MKRKIVKLSSLDEFDLCKKNGFEPLIDPRFVLSIDLRISAQNLTFGGSPLGQKNVAVGNVKFYKWVWDRKTQECEECGLPLEMYSSVFVSHIISRKAEPIMRWDCRNTNILCGVHHDQWENEPESMNIFSRNDAIIRQLQFEYNGRGINEWSNNRQ